MTFAYFASLWFWNSRLRNLLKICWLSVLVIHPGGALIRNPFFQWEFMKGRWDERRSLTSDWFLFSGKSLKLLMGAQPFWILFDANVIENWKRHIISQKGGNYPPLERRNKWNWKNWRAHKIEPRQILLNKSSGKCSWTTWANTTINLVIERNQLTSRSPIFSWHIEHCT